MRRFITPTVAAPKREVVESDTVISFYRDVLDNLTPFRHMFPVAGSVKEITAYVESGNDTDPVCFFFKIEHDNSIEERFISFKGKTKTAAVEVDIKPGSRVTVSGQANIKGEFPAGVWISFPFTTTKTTRIPQPNNVPIIEKKVGDGECEGCC